MPTLKELTTEYNEKAEKANSLGGEFVIYKNVFKEKKQLLLDKIDAVDAFIATVEPKTEKVEKTVTKTEEVKTMSKVTYAQFHVLNSFGKKGQAKVEDLKAKLEEKTGNGKGIHLILSQLGKAGLVEVYEEKGVKIADISKEGKEAAKQEEPAKPEKKEPATRRPRKSKNPVIEYAPPFSTEDLAELKKKKLKKALKANTAYDEAWVSLGGVLPSEAPVKRKRSTSQYEGTVEVGRWQKEGVTAVNATRDLWDLLVTPNILMTKADFVVETAKHKITESCAKRQFDFMAENEENVNQERLTIAKGVRGRGENPELPPFEKKEKKEKKDKKKGKKDKK